MDFFQQQDVARRKTGLLVFYFVATVILIVLSIYAVLAGIFLATGGDRQAVASGDAVGAARALWNPELFAGVGAATLAVIGGGSLYRVASLSGGGQTVAEMLHGRLVPPDSTDPAERRVLNVVEEMAIASGLPVPPVYILEHEKGINAFAAGHKPGDAVIGITRGAVDAFDRDELQGVIAHEFSHILNGDMRLNIRLMGILFGILAISTIGWILFRTSGFGMHRSYSNDGERKGGNPLPLVGLALYVIGYAGVIGGRLIKAAVSRQREYLADASAVQFTRNPGGIADALKKIGAISEGSRIEDPEAEEASHMFFGEATAAGLFGLLASHPPLVDRIQRIEPGFDGDFKAVREAWRAGRLREDGAPKEAVAAAKSRRFDPVEAITKIGNVDPQRLAMAGALLEAMPSTMVDAAREPFSARAVVFAVLMDRDEPEVRAAQLKALGAQVDRGTFDLSQALLPQAMGLAADSRLPLVDLTLPALRRMSKAQYEAFKVAVRSLMEADRRIDLFEFALHKMLMRHLTPQFEPDRPAESKTSRPEALVGSATVLLAAVSQAGQEGGDAVGQAYRVAVSALGWTGLGGSSPALDGVVDRPIGLPQVQIALDELAGAAPKLKKDLLRACAAAIALDGRVTIQEGELLRAISDSLDCPMPPLVAPRVGGEGPIG